MCFRRMVERLWRRGCSALSGQDVCVSAVMRSVGRVWMSMVVAAEVGRTVKAIKSSG